MEVVWQIIKLLEYPFLPYKNEMERDKPRPLRKKCLDGGADLNFNKRVGFVPACAPAPRVYMRGSIRSTILRTPDG